MHFEIGKFSLHSGVFNSCCPRKTGLPSLYPLIDRPSVHFASKYGPMGSFASKFGPLSQI